MSKKKESGIFTQFINNLPLKAKLILFAVIIIIFGAIIIVSASTRNSNTSPKAVEQEPTTSNSAESTEQESTEIDQSVAESYCQDAALLGKYINLKDIAIISIGNYNRVFSDDEATFDKDGMPIKMLQWNGKNRSTDEYVRFSCWISGDKDNIELHWLSVDGVDLVGSAAFASYDQDGQLLE